MRIMQVRNNMPTSQNRMTFKSQGSTVSDLYKEARLLFEQEVGAMKRELERPAKSGEEALMRYPFPPKELERQEVLALSRIEREAALERKANSAKHQENIDAANRGEKSALDALNDNLDTYFATQAKYEQQAAEAIERIHAPLLVGKFSDNLIEKFKVVINKAAEALLGGSSDPNDVRALVASKRFFNFNANLLRTEQNHQLSMDAWRKTIKVEYTRSDLASMFEAEEKK